MAFSPDGKTLAAGYPSAAAVGGVVLWDVAEWKRLADGPPRRDRGHRPERGLQPRRQDPRRRIAVGVGGGGVVLWDVGERERLAEGHLAVTEGDVQSMAFSPDGKTLAAGYGVGGVVAGWCCGTWGSGTPGRGPPGRDRGPVRSVAFSPDGKTLAAGYAVGGRRRCGAMGRGGAETPGRGRRPQCGLQPRRRRWLWNVDLDPESTSRQDREPQLHQKGMEGVFPRSALSEDL